MEKNMLIAVLVAVFLVGAFGGYMQGQRMGYAKGDTEGYARAEQDFKKVQQATAAKAAKDAAKVANPFQTVNPLQGVESNPFEKAKKVLNPFQ